MEIDKDIDEMQKVIEGKCPHCGIPPMIEWFGNKYIPAGWSDHDDSCPEYKKGQDEYSRMSGNGHLVDDYQ
jgi:hypothetical protein